MEDFAETENIEKQLTRVGKALDEYLKFEHKDAMHPSKDWLTQLNQPLPREGVGIDAVVNVLNDCLIPNGSAVPKPGFTAYITTGATTLSAVASTAAAIASPQRYGHTAFNFLEELSLDWMAEMFGLSNMKGVYSSGGSVANLVAMGAARQWAFESQGVDPAADGVDRAVGIYATTEAHHTIQRSLGVLGIGRNAIRAIDHDERGRMRCDLLEAAIQEDIANNILPMCVVGNAGSTNTGVIDPLKTLGQIAKQYGVWFHVDGAYGLPGILDERIAHLYDGIALVDSVIVDPHKWLGASVGIAATFVRDRQLLYRAFTQGPADYLEGSIEQQQEGQKLIEHSMDDFGIPYFNFGVELSAPCRGVVVWALIKEIGVQGMRDRIKRHNDMATRLADLCRNQSNLELVMEPMLSVCCFRFLDEEVDDLDGLNQTLCRQLVRENEHLPSTTKINGKLAIRPCFVGARTDARHVDELVAAVVRIGNQLVRQLKK